jgi:hypothetical protein
MDSGLPTLDAGPKGGYAESELSIYAPLRARAASRTAGPAQGQKSSATSLESP